MLLNLYIIDLKYRLKQNGSFDIINKSSGNQLVILAHIGKYRVSDKHF